MSLVFLGNLLGYAIVAGIVAIIHDFIVDKWTIRNITAIAVPVTYAKASGVRFQQQVAVSFDVEYRHWFFGRMFGPLPQAAYLITLQLNTSAVQCDPSIPQYCPSATGGIGSRIQHVEKSFSLIWDTVGVHDVPIDVSFDGKQLTNVSGSPNLKITMTIS